MNKPNRVASSLIMIAVVVFACAVARAQTPSPSPTPQKSTPSKTATPTEAGEDAGNYTIVSSVEIGVRGLRVDGDDNKFRSDLNYHAGVRLFDGSFLARSKNNKGELFDTLMVTSTGWGADPYGQLRISVEKPKWYRFEGNYRRLKYFNFLNNIANPNWVFSPATFARPPNPDTGLHGMNTRMQFGDFDLTLLPKNRTVRFTLGYSPERYSGPAFQTYHIGGNEFMLLSNLRSRADDFRLGADGAVGPIDFSIQQGFRRYRDDSFVSDVPQFINANPAVARFTTFNRNEPTRTHVNYTTASVHAIAAKKLDITGRLVYSRTNSDFAFAENMTGTNFSTRITGQLAPPNTLLLGQYSIPGDTRRPNTLGEIGLTYLATDKLRISNTFRAETFTIDGADVFNDFFSVQRGTTTDTRTFTNLPFARTIKYRKIQNTIEGDYQFNKNYSFHLGYRYGTRRDEVIESGFALNTNAPAALTPTDEVDRNHTHVFFAGFRARPANNWTIYFDAEHGTADNVFTRIGEYNFTNFRAKSRYAPNRKVAFNLELITRDNANPSEIAGISLSDFGIGIKSRTFTSSVDWTPNSRWAFNTGYNYNWVNSDAVVDYFYNSIEHPVGHSLYFMRNNFFFINGSGQIWPRVTIFAAYRVNQDSGQGNRLADPTGTPGILLTSYPMSFQSPEARVAVKLSKRIDWNVGYQYYNYRESQLVGPRPQNYHAHLPYTSLRIYFGRRE